MSNRISKILTSILSVFLAMTVSSAQDGAGISYSPYSVFGIGDLYQTGNARDISMGGVGIAGRDTRYINMVNPAGLSARDTLSVMFDIGMVSENRVFRQHDLKSANNTLNVNNFAMSCRLYRTLAFSAGITPYSNVGYDYAYDISDPDLMATAGFINYLSSGRGGLYQGFLGFGVSFWDRISIGAEVLYNFGNITKDSSMSFSESTFRSMNSGYALKLNAVSGKFGIQYDQPIGDVHLTLGATYRTSAPLKGYVTDYKYATLGSVTDTVYHHVDTLAATKSVSLASEKGLGISLRKSEKWAVEFNYTRSDWTKSGFETTTGFANVGNSVFTTRVSESYKVGFELIPNANDMRYYMRQCSYRMGFHYDKNHMRVDDRTLETYGITLGMTLPVFRWYNGISIGVDFGKRGCSGNNMTLENYATFVIGFNIHDMWFVKHRYE